MQQKKNTALWFVIAALLIAIILLIAQKFLFDAPKNKQLIEQAQSETDISAKNANAKAKAGTTATAAAQLFNNTSLTYRPGQARALRQYMGVIDSKQLSSAWWLYAKSEDEARWMDAYGYPTPAEEAKLRAASKEELTRLSVSGDLNAKAQLLSREFVDAFQKADLKDVPTLRAQVAFLIGEGGPYQATTILQAYGKLHEVYRAIPEDQRTETQTKYLQELGISFRLAELTAAVYSDDAAQTVRNEVFNLVGASMFSANMRFDYPVESFVNGLAWNSKTRARKSLPALTIAARPQAPAGGSPVYLERY